MREPIRELPTAGLHEDGRAVFICYERCLYCGRRVALGHQACLLDIMGTGRSVRMTEDDGGWKAEDFDLPQEPCDWCDNDRAKECPILLYEWGPAEKRADADVDAAHLVVVDLANKARRAAVPLCGHEWDDDLGHRRCELPSGHTSEKHEARIPPTTKSGLT